MRRLVALLISLVVSLSSASTTTANAATFSYDAPTISRVEVHELDVAPANPARLSGSREGSALPRVATRGVSTTLLTRDNAELRPSWWSRCCATVLPVRAGSSAAP